MRKLMRAKSRYALRRWDTDLISAFDQANRRSAPATHITLPLIPEPSRIPAMTEGFAMPGESHARHKQRRSP